MWDKKKISEEYYSNFPKKLIFDYVQGNPRTTAAINFFISQISIDAKNILDVGCGIGWSSFEMASKFDLQVFGIDLSQNSITAGNKIFKLDKLFLEKKDILTDDFGEAKYDVITFLDVFEHIPKDKRKELYKKLTGMLNPKSKILLTCPTIYHQKYLRENSAEGLQPVDEDVDLVVLTDFARFVNGEISFFSYRSIWHKNDYFHCAIEVGSEFSERLTPQSILLVDDLQNRLKRIKKSIYYKNFEKELPIIENTPLLGRILRKLTNK